MLFVSLSQTFTVTSLPSVGLNKGSQSLNAYTRELAAQCRPTSPTWILGSGYMA